MLIHEPKSPIISASEPVLVAGVSIPAVMMRTEVARLILDDIPEVYLHALTLIE